MTPVFIMAVPFDPPRAVNAKRLSEQTGGTVVWDQKQSISDTFLRLLEAAGDQPAIFLQDDVVLADNWRTRVEEVIQERGDSVIQFFSIRKADLSLPSRWVPGREYLMNQCYYVPNPHELLEYATQWFEDNPGHTGDDTCISEWLKSRKQKYWHHVPSLVQHREWKSAVHEGRSSRRISPTFGE